MGIQNVKMGPCNVTWNSVSLGLTKGGVTVAIATAIDDKPLIGQRALYDPIIKSVDVKITCPLAESVVASLQTAFPWGTLASSIYTIKDISGARARTYAKTLTVTPVVGTDVITVAYALPVSQTNLSFSIDSERIVSVTFIALPSDDGSLITMSNW